MRFWDTPELIKNTAAIMSYWLYRYCSYPVIVASTGRSGSTMLCHSIMNSSFKEKTGLKSPRFVFFPAFSPDKALRMKYRVGGVYKTHLLPEYIPNHVKKIFIFDSPIITYTSFNLCIERYGKKWGIQHLKNLQSPYEIKDINKDVDFLNYEAQLLSWLEYKEALCINFRDLWRYQEKMSAYLEMPLLFPSQIERKTRVDGDNMNKTINKLNILFEAAVRH